MSEKLIVFDTHPVQYRAPIWRSIESENPGSLHVVYGSDCSVRGHLDTDFGLTIAWDEPLLEGYANTILDKGEEKPNTRWWSRAAKGIGDVLDKLDSKAILLTGLDYKYGLVAYWEARRRGIPLWLRCETQDQAFLRPKVKSVVRSILYRAAYRSFDRIFYIGQLNRKHYLEHGVPESKLREAPYGTVDRFAGMSDEEKQRQRNAARAEAGIADGDFVVGFSGKLISKKNPGILFRMLENLPPALRSRTVLYFLGSGELEGVLRQEADEALRAFGVRSFFAGFVNQSKLAAHYLAMDIMVLPSRRMGETWGLVANEAMQAGCGVVVSDAVGCSADFKSWERFRVFPEGDVIALSNCIADLARFPRSFGWARPQLSSYSIDAVAHSIVRELKTLP